MLRLSDSDSRLLNPALRPGARNRATRVVCSQDRHRVTRQCRIGWVSFEVKDGVQSPASSGTRTAA